MTQKLPPNRIPAESMTDYQAWRLPIIDDNGRVLSSAEKEAKDKQAAQEKRDNESIEDINMPSAGQVGMTAQDMQEIFDTAEKEGFAQGHKEGLEKGQAEGFAAGQQQGLMEMREQLTLEQERFQTLISALTQPMLDQDRDIEKMLVDTICTLTRSVVQRELLIDSSHILALVQAAVAALPIGSKNLRVFLNPQDLAAVEYYANAQQLDWTFIGDALLPAGGCRVETAESRVDFTVAQRLKTLLDQFVNKQLADADTDSDAAEQDVNL